MIPSLLVRFRPRTVVTLVLHLLLLVTYTCGTLTADQKLDWLNRHNTIRCNVNPAATVMSALVWDLSLESVAQTHADSCPSMNSLASRNALYQQLSGNSTLTCGENIALGYDTYTDANTFWYSERTSALSNKIHYNQQIWSTTLRLGCAQTSVNCQDYGTAVYVCLYSPPASDGQPPYTIASTAVQTDACRAQSLTSLPTVNPVIHTTPQVTSTSSSISSAVEIGIIVGVIAGVFLLCIVFMCYYRHTHASFFHSHRAHLQSPPTTKMKHMSSPGSSRLSSIPQGQAWSGTVTTPPTPLSRTRPLSGVPPIPKRSYALDMEMSVQASHASHHDGYEPRVGSGVMTDDSYDQSQAQAQQQSYDQPGLDITIQRSSHQHSGLPTAPPFVQQVPRTHSLPHPD